MTKTYNEKSWQTFADVAKLNESQRSTKSYHDNKLVYVVAMLVRPDFLKPVLLGYCLSMLLLTQIRDISTGIVLGGLVASVTMGFVSAHLFNRRKAKDIADETYYSSIQGIPALMIAKSLVMQKTAVQLPMMGMEFTMGKEGEVEDHLSTIVIDENWKEIFADAYLAVKEEHDDISEHEARRIAIARIELDWAEQGKVHWLNPDQSN